MSLYEHSSIPIQNLCCTIYGARQRAQMYGGWFRKYLENYRENERATSSQLLALQLRGVESVLEKAVRNVPYYVTHAADYKPGPSGLTWERFRQFPLLPKELVRSKTQEFVSRRIRRFQTHVGRTSGTTGTPMRITTTFDAFRQAWAAMERLRAWGGVSRYDRRASFTGKVFVPTSGDPKGVFWRRDYIGRRLLLSVYHLNADTISAYIRAISMHRTAFIDGYPNAIRRVARYLAEQSIDMPTVEAIFPTAETLTPESRKEIEQGFGARVHNQYGSSELSCHAGECEYGTMHISPEIGIVEVLDGNGAPTAPGQVGNVVLTGLVNEAMPLIRYKIGDMAIAPDPGRVCSCGRAFPILDGIVGRSDDLVRTADGRALPIMNYHVFKWARGVKEAQLIQEKYDCFRMIVVPDGESVDLSRSIVELEARMGHCVQVKIEQTDKISRTSAGKLRSVISYVSA